MSDEKKAMLVVSSKVKAYAKAKGLSIGKEALERLSAEVEKLVDAAGGKATGDRRKTIKSRDFDGE